MCFSESEVKKVILAQLFTEKLECQGSPFRASMM